MKLFDNIQMLDNSGTLLAYVSKKSMDWYVKRNLATVISESAFQLNFKANGNGSGFIIEKNNVCVVCGSTNKLTKHHIVPKRFRKYLHEEYKSRNSFDIVALCETHHHEYETISQKFDSEIITNLNLNDEYEQFLENIKTSLNIKKKLNRILISYPDFGEIELQALEDCKQVYPDLEVTDEWLMQKIDEHNGIIRSKNNFSKTVVEKCESPEAFISMWRTHFLNTMNPHFLTDEWLNYRDKCFKTMC